MQIEFTPSEKIILEMSLQARCSEIYETIITAELLPEPQRSAMSEAIKGYEKELVAVTKLLERVRDSRL